MRWPSEIWQDIGHSIGERESKYGESRPVALKIEMKHVGGELQGRRENEAV